eukprot:c19187_g1_i3.p1 GENE.c19187_g1_i3~~c19187_g1_i3.p1  ORF type:complete len:423 (+),score=140.33 c19187_g1_i3:34-1269(+)
MYSFGELHQFRSRVTKYTNAMSAVMEIVCKARESSATKLRIMEGHIDQNESGEENKLLCFMDNGAVLSKFDWTKILDPKSESYQPLSQNLPAACLRLAKVAFIFGRKKGKIDQLNLLFLSRQLCEARNGLVIPMLEWEKLSDTFHPSDQPPELHQMLQVLCQYAPNFNQKVLEECVNYMYADDASNLVILSNLDCSKELDLNSDKTDIFFSEFSDDGTAKRLVPSHQESFRKLLEESELVEINTNYNQCVYGDNRKIIRPMNIVLRSIKVETFLLYKTWKYKKLIRFQLVDEGITCSVMFGLSTIHDGLYYYNNQKLIKRRVMLSNYRLADTLNVCGCVDLTEDPSPKNCIGLYTFPSPAIESVLKYHLLIYMKEARSNHKWAIDPKLENFSNLFEKKNASCYIKTCLGRI